MKVGIIGATGKVGSLLTKELKDRGHDVTAIIRNPGKMTDDSVPLIERNIFYITTDVLRGFDVIVDAFGTQDEENLEFQYQTSMITLIHALEPLPDTRFIVVGGAASLFTDDTRAHRVLETIPEEYRAIPENAFEAYKMLAESKVNWTYMSPAITFDPKGERTGHYTIGEDIVVTNKKGESYISYADYVIALRDEIEHPRFIRKRFTAVSEPVARNAVSEPKQQKINHDAESSEKKLQKNDITAPKSQIKEVSYIRTRKKSLFERLFKR